MSQLTCHDLSLGYEGREIISNLSFHVNAGDYLCIVGENGSGKSTLMKTLLGLRKPMKGVVQKDFPASVREIVISGFQGRSGLRPFYTKAEKRIALENIRKMGIEHLQNRCYRELSGGQQQRVLLARALCATRKMLLLDEPVAGLDPKVTADMYELIEVLNQEEGITIIMISHDIEAALRYATHVLHIGSNIFFGTRSQFIDSKIGRQLYNTKGAHN